MHIDDALAARLGKLGNLVLLVAIDGPARLHDARRGAGSYERVHAALARLRKHGAVYGFSCMVSAKSFGELTSPAFLRAREESGCAIGIYSRYFPLTGDSLSDLAISGSTLTDYRARFEQARKSAALTILDLDDVEQHTGCHSRAGESIYIDGITGRVAPCLRVPFGPEECTLTADDELCAAPRRQLSEILSHRFFTEYRTRDTTCPSWCGANLELELKKVARLLDAVGPGVRVERSNERLPAYEERSREAVRQNAVSTLEATPRFWEIGAVTLAPGDATPVTPRVLRPKAAPVDHGADIAGALQENDGARLSLLPGKHADVIFDAPAAPDQGMRRTVIARLRGYYDLDIGGPVGVNPAVVLAHRFGWVSLPRYAQGLASN